MSFLPCWDVETPAWTDKSQLCSLGGSHLLLVCPPPSSWWECQMILKSFQASFSSFPLPRLKVCPSRPLSIPSCHRNFWQIAYIQKRGGISPMTHPITWGPPLCRLQTNPDQLNPLLHSYSSLTAGESTLTSWNCGGNGILLILLRPRTDFGFCKLVTFFLYKFDSVHLLYARTIIPEH